MSEVVSIWEIHGLFIGKMNASNENNIGDIKGIHGSWDILETPFTFEWI